MARLVQAQGLQRHGHFAHDGALLARAEHVLGLVRARHQGAETLAVGCVEFVHQRGQAEQGAVDRIGNIAATGLDRADRGVDLVCHACDQLAKCGHLLRMHQLRFGLVLVFQCLGCLLAGIFGDGKGVGVGQRDCRE